MLFAVVHHNGNNRYLRVIFDTREAAEAWIANLQVQQEWMRAAYRVHELPVNTALNGLLLEI